MRKAFALILLVVAANAALWAGLNRPATDIPDWNQRISGAAWSPYPIDGGPARRFGSDAELRADMERMAPHMRAVRTYTALNGIDRLPEIAAGLPLTFMLGAWVDDRVDRSWEEVERHYGIHRFARAGAELRVEPNQERDGGGLHVSEHALCPLVARLVALGPLDTPAGLDELFGPHGLRVHTPHLCA